MGSLKSNNPAHLDNGASYRILTSEINDKLELIKPYVAINHKLAIIAHDELLARRAAIESVTLSMSGSGLLLADKNSVAKDYSKLAIDSSFFCERFNKYIMEVM